MMNNSQLSKSHLFDFYKNLPSVESFEYALMEQLIAFADSKHDHLALNGAYQISEQRALSEGDLKQLDQFYGRYRKKYGLAILEQHVEALEKLLLELGLKRSEKVNVGIGIELQNKEFSSCDQAVLVENEILNSEFFRVMCESFGMPADLGERFDVAFYNNPQLTNYNYLYREAEKGEFVAMANLCVNPKLPEVGVLAGAAVTEKYRHRGIYTQLLDHRLLEAKKNGVKYVVMMSTEASSYQPAIKFGFQDLGARFLNYEKM